MDGVRLMKKLSVWLGLFYQLEERCIDAFPIRRLRRVISARLARDTVDTAHLAPFSWFLFRVRYDKGRGEAEKHSLNGLQRVSHGGLIEKHSHLSPVSRIYTAQAVTASRVWQAVLLMSGAITSPRADDYTFPTALRYTTNVKSLLILQTVITM